MPVGLIIFTNAIYSILILWHCARQLNIFILDKSFGNTVFPFSKMGNLKIVYFDVYLVLRGLCFGAYHCQIRWTPKAPLLSNNSLVFYKGYLFRLLVRHIWEGAISPWNFNSSLIDLWLESDIYFIAVKLTCIDYFRFSNQKVCFKTSEIVITSHHNETSIIGPTHHRQNC